MTQKLRKGEQSLLYTAHSLGLIHIPLKFYEDIRNSYRVMGNTRIKITQNKHKKHSKGPKLSGKIDPLEKRENLQNDSVFSGLMLWLFVGPTRVYLLDFFCSGIQFYLLLSPYLCFISLLYLDLYVLGNDAFIS